MSTLVLTTPLDVVIELYRFPLTETTYPLKAIVCPLRLFPELFNLVTKKDPNDPWDGWFYLYKYWNI